MLNLNVILSRGCTIALFSEKPTLNPQKDLNVVLSALYLDQSHLSFCFVTRFRGTDALKLMSATVSR